MKKNALVLILLLLGATLGCLAHASTTWNTQDYALFTGDFNGDGRDDILYVSTDGTKPSGIVLTNSSGQPTTAFQSWPSNYLGIDWSTSQYNVIVADFNHDGHADILLQSKTPGDSYLLLANSQGLITGISQTIAEDTAGVAWSADQHHIVVGDFNGDGRPDVFLQATSPSGINAVILAAANGEFTASSPAQSWNDGYLGFNWATTEANVYAGDFNGDGYADLLIQAKPKWVMINFDVPFPVPTYPPDMNGVVLAESGGGLFQATGVQRWSQNAFGANWSPLSSNIIIGKFDTASCAACSDVILQGTNSATSSYLVLGNSSGTIFSNGTALASNATWTANAYTLIAGNFSGTGYSTGIYFEATSPTGTDYVADSVSGSTVTLTTSNTTQETAQTPTSAGRTAAQFSVTPTGGASYNIPLWTPPGARNIEPHLALHYLSGGPDGVMGPGWSLSGMPVITRCNRTFADDGAPGAVTLSSTDALCLNGVRLQSVSGYTPYCPSGSPYSSTATYETEVTGFDLVSACGTSGNGPAYFEVQGKDGRYYEYGNGSNSEVFASGATTPFMWGLDKASDRQGNNMVLTYVSGSTVLTPNTIEYTQTPSTGSTYPYEVTFSYSSRPGGTSITKYVAGAAVTEASVLTLVNVLSSNTSVRQYQLIYSSSPTTGRPLLSFVQECGGSAGTDCLRPTSITYQSGSDGWSGAPVSTGIDGQYGYIPVDLNGDGIPDALYGKVSGSTVVWYARIATLTGFGPEISTGAVTTGGATPIVGAFAGTGKQEFLVPAGNYLDIYSYNGSDFTESVTNASACCWDFAADWDGDGLPDLVSNSANAVVVLRNTTQPGQSVTFATSPTTVYNYPANSSTNLLYPSRATPADFNGDGRADLIVQYATYNSYANVYTYYANVLMSNGFSQLASVTPLYQSTGGGPFPQFQFGDWNGDGCTDIIATNAIWVSNCAGGFTEIASSVPNTSNGTPAAILAVDWDGDGQTDRLYADPTTSTWMVQRSTGNNVSSPVSTGIPVTTKQSFFIADQNSDGQQDLEYIDAGNGYNVSYYPHQGIASPPDLANSFSDGFAISFSPSYVPISQESYAKGTSATFPDQDYQGAAYVVDEYSAPDGTGGTYEETLAYAGARLNLQGRGFEGFATAQIQDSRNGVIRTTDYRQDYPYTGMVSEQDLNQGVVSLSPGEAPVSPAASSLMGKTTNQYATVLAQGSNCAGGVCFPYLQQQTKYTYEVDAPLSGSQIATSSTTYAYDNFGNITQTSSVLTDTDDGGNGAPASPYYEEQWTEVIANHITNDTSTWCLGRPYETTTTKSTPGGSATRTVNHTMDYQNCRATQEIVQPNDPKLQVTTTFDFDGCGNTDSISVVGLDQNGNAMPARTTGYNYGTMCIFPEKETDALGETTTTAYDYALGLKSSVTDPNGVTTASWQYDDFGRPELETFADETKNQWTYSDCVSSDCWGTADLRFLTTEVSFDSNGNQTQTDEKYADGLDRLRLECTYRALGVWTTAEVAYDSMGRKARVYLPYSSSGNGYNGFTYDIANRTLSDTLYDSSGNVYRTTSVEYLGLITQVTDALGNVTQRAMDVSGKLRQVTDPPADGSPTAGVTKYTYDPFGNLITVDDPDGIVSTYSYNIRGFKTAFDDANSGSWSFVPDSLNELASQTDAKGQTTTFSYDALGRLQYRYEPESTTPITWTYGSSATAHNIGKLAAVSDPNGYAESYVYDNLGRQQTIVYTEGGVNYQYDYGYNSLGKVGTITYPTSTSGYRFELRYVYDSWGYLNETQDANAGTVFWQLDGENDSGLPTGELLGNGVQVDSSYMPWTNELVSRSEGSGGSTNNLASLSYTWDVDGNLHERQDLIQNLSEVFGLDPLNRITSTTLNGTQTLSVNYDAAGDIQSKSDVGSYTYGNSAHPHAVTAAGTWTMSYDADGNMTSRDGGAISWYSYNQPNAISFGASSTQFLYDSNHQRYKQAANYAGTTETTYYVGGMLQVVTRNGVTQYRHQIPGGSATVIYTRGSNGTNSTYYSSSDHQSSTNLVMGSGGNVLATASFTPFGARRGSNWQGVPTTADYNTFASSTRQGYTSQEMLDSVSIVDMNGRVYDPYLGRFLSADNVIQNLAVSQSVNPYSYAWNNPLKYLDPSGNSLLGDIAGLIAGIVMAIIFPPSSIWLAMLDGFVGGFVGAAVSTGNLTASLEMGLIGAATAGLFYEAGTLAQDYAGKAWQAEGAVVAHAAVGCVSAVMSSGNCGKGALAAGIAELADRSNLVGALSQWGTDREEVIEGTAVSGVIGGAIARVTGGSFTDGFSVAAAGYLFNDAAHYEFIEMKIAEIIQVGYNTNGEFSAEFVKGDTFELNVTDGTATVSQGGVSWSFPVNGVVGDGTWSFSEKLLGMELKLTPLANGDLEVSGSYEVKYGILSFEFGATTTVSVVNAILDNSGLLGTAARDLKNAGSSVDSAVDCESRGLPAGC